MLIVFLKKRNEIMSNNHYQVVLENIFLENMIDKKKSMNFKNINNLNNWPVKLHFCLELVPI